LDAVALAPLLAEPDAEPPTRERVAAPDAQPDGLVDREPVPVAHSVSVGDAEADDVAWLALPVRVARAESEMVGDPEREGESVGVDEGEPLEEADDDLVAPPERETDGEPLAEPLTDGDPAAEGDRGAETDWVRVCVLVKGVTVPVKTDESDCVTVAGRKRVMVPYGDVESCAERVDETLGDADCEALGEKDSKAEAEGEPDSDGEPESRPDLDGDDDPLGDLLPDGEPVDVPLAEGVLVLVADGVHVLDCRGDADDDAVVDTLFDDDTDGVHVPVCFGERVIEAE